MPRKVLIYLTLLLVCVVPASVQSPVNNEFALQVLHFEVRWDPFIRKLFGCPLTGVIDKPQEQCKLALGRLDYKDWRQARESAKKLFDLQDVP